MFLRIAKNSQPGSADRNIWYNGHAMDTSTKFSWIAERFLIVVVILLTSCQPVGDRSTSTQTQSKDQPTKNEPVTSQPEQTDPSKREPSAHDSSQKEPAKTQTSESKSSPDQFTEARQRMVKRQMADRDIVNQRVLNTMQKVPRHKFVAADMQDLAYHDSPLTIGKGQTISQPYIVALMTQLVNPQPHHKALDIGTGSGYQAAVLAELVKDVYSIEIVESLATEARARLETMGYQNIEVRHGDGYRGWKSEAPFDVIIVAAAPDHIPEALVEQLAPGGKLVIPVGDFYQSLIVVEKKPDGSVEKNDVAPVRFVPMTGEARK